MRQRLRLAVALEVAPRVAPTVVRPNGPPPRSRRPPPDSAVVGSLTSPLRPLCPCPLRSEGVRDGRGGRRPRPGIGARSAGCASAGASARAAIVRRRRQEGNVGGREVGAGTVPTRGVAPPAGGVTGDIDADFHHQPGFRQRDVQLLPAAPPGGERPARPRMPAPSRLEQAGDRGACRSCEGRAAADVLEAAFGVVPAQQQRPRVGQGARDRTDDRLTRLADLLAKRRCSDLALFDPCVGSADQAGRLRGLTYRTARLNHEGGLQLTEGISNRLETERVSKARIHQSRPQWRRSADTQDYGVASATTTYSVTVAKKGPVARW